MPKVAGTVFDHIATSVLCCCAIVVTVLVARRELYPSVTATVQARSIDGWDTLGASGHTIGPSNALVTIIEFADFECPYCATVQAPLHALRERFADSVRVVFRHFPLESIHPHALEAAVASECAADQHLFEQYQAALFEDQDSIGKKSWRQFAVAVGIPDTTEFRVCVQTVQPLARVRADARTARLLELPGTPALIVNGQLLAGALTGEVLEGAVRRALSQSREGAD